MDLTLVWPYVTFATVPAAAWAVVRASDRMERSWRRTLVRRVAKFVRFTSLLLLVLTIPSGAIDISDLWVFVALALVPALLLLATVKARLIHRKWVRVSATGISGLLFGLASLAFLLFSGFEAACVARRNLYSPDGSHVAMIRISQQGAVGIDQGSVSLRRSWRVIALPVWIGIVQYNFDGRGSISPQVKWLDNSRLHIRYHADPSITRLPGYPVVCGGMNQPIEVVCHNEFRAEYYPAPKPPAASLR